MVERIPGPGPVYTAQLTCMETPEIAGEIRTWAILDGIASSALLRECIEKGLDVLRPELERALGSLKGAKAARILAEQVATCSRTDSWASRKSGKSGKSKPVETIELLTGDEAREALLRAQTREQLAKLDELKD